MPNWRKVIVSGSDATLNTLFVANAVTASTISASLGITGSLFGTASWATNAVNGGVTQITAGTNITINQSTGNVTINSSAATGLNSTGSFTNQSTWTFTHGLANQAVIIQAYDTSWNQIIPQNITLTNTNTASITFSSARSGYAIASLGGTTTSAATASYINSLSQSVIITGSIQGNVTALSIASNTASLNLLTGNFFTLQLVSGSATHINPSNIRPGLTVNVLVSTTGSATVTFPTTIKTGSAYVPTTTVGKDILTFVSFDSTNLYLATIKNLA